MDWGQGICSQTSAQSWQWIIIVPAYVALWHLVVLHGFWVIPGGQTSACNPIWLMYHAIISMLVPCLSDVVAGKHGIAILFFPDLCICPYFSTPLAWGNLGIWMKCFFFHAFSNHLVYAYHYRAFWTQNLGGKIVFIAFCQATDLPEGKKDKICQLPKEGKIKVKWRGGKKRQIKISKCFPSKYGLRVVYNRWLKQKQRIHFPVE